MMVPGCAVFALILVNPLGAPPGSLTGLSLHDAEEMQSKQHSKHQNGELDGEINPMRSLEGRIFEEANGHHVLLVR
jgi:hypothetical protein